MRVVGTGWQGRTDLIAPGDFDSDKYDDGIAKTRFGQLILYPGNGQGAKQIGQGWNIFNRVFSPGTLAMISIRIS